jgi:hypothetical protein
MDTSGFWIAIRTLKFLHAFPFSNNNVFTSIDSKTGRPPSTSPSDRARTQGAEFCPSIGGGKDWPPEAWSPQTKLLYIPANNNLCAFLPKGQVPDEGTKGIYVGYEIERHLRVGPDWPGRQDHIGELQAWDLNTGKKVWQHNFKAHLWAPLLVTGGDVLFAGGTQDRQFRAFQRPHRRPAVEPSPASPAPSAFPPPSRSTASSTSLSRRLGPRCARRPERPRRDQQRPRRSCRRAGPSSSSAAVTKDRDLARRPRSRLPINGGPNDGNNFASCGAVRRRRPRCGAAGAEQKGAAPKAAEVVLPPATERSRSSSCPFQRARSTA